MGLCCRAVFALFFFFIVCFYAYAFAGNKKMVETRTEEMDDQNKQMVRQIPNLPKNGKIDAKARVVNDRGNLIFDVYQIQTSAKEEKIILNGSQQKQEKKDGKSSGFEKKEIIESINIPVEQNNEEKGGISITDIQGNNKDIKIFSNEQQKEVANETVVTDIQVKENTAKSASNEKVSK